MATDESSFRTGKILIDRQKCKNCQNYACAKACSLFGRNLFRIKDGKLTIANPEEFKKRCIECLACELYCQNYGNKGLFITLNMFGLDEYRRKKK